MEQIIAMLARVSDGAMLMDQQGRIAFWNQAAERLFGLRAEEVIGRPCHEVICGRTLDGQPMCSPSCTVASRLATGKGVRNFDVQSRTKAGRVLWLNVSSLPVPTRKKGQFLAAHLFRDITKQAKVRHLTEELHVALCRMVAAPEVPPAPANQDLPPEVPSTLPLSERERVVLCLLAAGEDTKTIADHLCISPATVRNHIQHILEKLGAHSRLQALAIAFHPGARPSQ